MQETENSVFMEKFEEFSEQINRRINDLENKIENVARDMRSMKSDAEFDVKMLRVELDMKIGAITAGENLNRITSRKMQEILDENRSLVKSLDQNLEKIVNERGNEHGRDCDY